MNWRNFTPFATLAFESVNARGGTFHTAVLKGTFRIENGAVLRPEPAQKPLTMADEFYGEPGATSPKAESDLAPFKPATDVYFIDPKAQAPAGRPRPDRLV